MMSGNRALTSATVMTVEAAAAFIARTAQDR
jgi:hypothetical protein